MNIRELTERVYTARHQLFRSGIQDLNDWVVVINPDDWCALHHEFREREDLRAYFEAFAPVDSWPLTDHATVFGLRIVRDKSIEPGKVTLRLEIAA